MKKTSRAKSIRRNGKQQYCDSVEQHPPVKIPAHRLNRSRSALKRSTKTVKTREATDFSKSEAEMVDVMDTLQHVISIIGKEMAKNVTFLQKEIGTRNKTNVMAALIMIKTSMSMAFSKQC